MSKQELSDVLVSLNLIQGNWDKTQFSIICIIIFKRRFPRKSNAQTMSNLEFQKYGTKIVVFNPLMVRIQILSRFE